VTAAVTVGPGVEVGRVRDPADYLALERLYRSVFGVRDGEGSINARLLTAIDQHSGIVVVAREADELLGFACSFLSRDPVTGRLYQYSQTAAVRTVDQGRGIGRALKQAQRAEALAGGVDLMRWAFDPLRARNAHVNLDVLGGRVRTFHRNLYGAAVHGRDDGDRTDRAIVDWELAPTVAPPAPPAIPADTVPAPGGLVRVGDSVLVPIPADWDAARRRLGLASALALRAEIAGRIDEALAAGLVAVSCRRVDPDTACYIFAPDVPGEAR
jgi:predicted GNAT superfamily acetyltransferase